MKNKHLAGQLSEKKDNESTKMTKNEIKSN